MPEKHDPNTTEHFNKLIQFRQAAYERLGLAQDALFELTDAVIATPAAQSFVSLPGFEYFQRKWSSVYDALQDGRPKREELMKLYSEM